MNSDKHFMIGGISTFAASCITQKQSYGSVDLGKALIHGLLGGGIALLPDILEPATNPNHRSFFHSISLGLGILLANNKLRENPDLSNELKNNLLLISLAYGTHLLSDSITPKSLPLVY